MILAFSPLFSGSVTATRQSPIEFSPDKIAFSPLFSGSVTATRERGCRTTAPADLSVPYSKGRSLQLQEAIKVVSAADAFSPLFQGSVTATLLLGWMGLTRLMSFSPLFQGSVTATGIPFANFFAAFVLSVPYSKGRSLQPTLSPRTLTQVNIFQSPIPRVGHCNQNTAGLEWRVLLSFSPLFQGSVTATSPDKSCICRIWQYFQSPIPRVGHCNQCQWAKWRDWLALSVPYSQGRLLQRNYHGAGRHRGIRFQSPIPRVGHCNGGRWRSGRHPGAFSPLFQGSVTATFVEFLSGCRDRYLSVPYSKGRSLQLSRHIRHSLLYLSFSPLFQGSVTATQRTVHLQSWRIISFSPLFQGSVTATTPSFAGSKRPSSLSVPYSKGRSLQRTRSRCRPGKGFSTFSPLFQGSVTATCPVCAIAWKTSSFSPLFQGSVTATRPGCGTQRYCGRTFSPLFQGSVTATVYEELCEMVPEEAFSPLFQGSVTATSAAKAKALQYLDLSVPYSKGRSLQR